ncbi:Protein of unknown function [Gryllus bimaculatus]|nr:Protein of unknown function [Gryllus bimaculatus]
MEENKEQADSCVIKVAIGALIWPVPAAPPPTHPCPSLSPPFPSPSNPSPAYPRPPPALRLPQPPLVRSGRFRRRPRTRRLEPRRAACPASTSRSVAGCEWERRRWYQCFGLWREGWRRQRDGCRRRAGGDSGTRWSVEMLVAVMMAVVMLARVMTAVVMIKMAMKAVVVTVTVAVPVAVAVVMGVAAAAGAARGQMRRRSGGGAARLREPLGLLITAAERGGVAPLPTARCRSAAAPALRNHARRHQHGRRCAR